MRMAERWASPRPPVLLHRAGAMVSPSTFCSLRNCMILHADKLYLTTTLLRQKPARAARPAQVCGTRDPNFL